MQEVDFLATNANLNKGNKNCQLVAILFPILNKYSEIIMNDFNKLS
jgi:hypothetical protein